MCNLGFTDAGAMPIIGSNNTPQAYGQLWLTTLKPGGYLFLGQAK